MRGCKEESSTSTTIPLDLHFDDDTDALPFLARRIKIL